MNNLSINITLRTLFSRLFNLYLVILLFDPMRESLAMGGLNGLISVGRDFLIFALLCVLLIGKQKKDNSIFLLAFAFSILVLFVLSLFAEVNYIESIKTTYILCRGLCLCYIIANLKIYYCYSTLFIIKYLIILSIINFIITLVIYFGFPEMIVEKFTGNRVCVGNPSLQSIIFCSSFTLCFYYKPFSSLSLILSAILLIATIITVTSTAFVAIIIIFILTVFKKNYFFNWVILLTIFILILMFLGLFSNIDFSVFLNLIDQKNEELLQLINKYLSGGADTPTQSESFSIRESQINQFRNNVDGISLLFGDGIFSMITPEKTMIENTFWALLKDFGIFGLITYVIFLFKYFLKGLQVLRSSRSSILLITVLIIIAYSTTLYIFSTTSMLIQLILFLFIVNNMEVKHAAY